LLGFRIVAKQLPLGGIKITKNFPYTGEELMLLLQQLKDET
jgi:hypothetical protein